MINQPPTPSISATPDDEQALAVEAPRDLERRRDQETDPHKRHRFDEEISATRAEYGLPEGAA